MRAPGGGSGRRYRAPRPAQCAVAITRREHSWADEPARSRCMDRSSQRVATAVSRMQEQDGLRSRAGGRSQLVRCARGSCGCRHARSARGSGRWPSARRSTSRALERSSRPALSAARKHLPTGGSRGLLRPRRAPWTNVGSQRPDPRPRKPSRWSAGRGEEVVAGLLAAAAGSGADATVVVVRGVPVTLLARQGGAQAWIVARRRPTSPADWPGDDVARSCAQASARSRLRRMQRTNSCTSSSPRQESAQPVQVAAQSTHSSM